MNNSLNDFLETGYFADMVGKELLPHRQIKYPVDFDDELKIGDVRYKHLTKITIKVQLF